MSFRVGEFDRSQTGVFRAFCPAHAVGSLPEVDLASMWEQGKRLLLLDVDHTLVQWKGEDFAPAVLDWIARAKSIGFELCIISNTRRVDRLARLSEKLGVETVKGKFKPSTAMFQMALSKFNRKPEEALMIGDQIMTDILGANRAGIDAIWVQKMDGPEFAGTKVNRTVEKMLTGVIYRALVTPVDENPSPQSEAKVPFYERAIFRQLIKFGVVGVTSFAIDWIIRSSMQERIRIDGELLSELGGHWLKTTFPQIFSFARTDIGAFAPISFITAATIATFNSFIWNRAWTFEVKNKAERSKQLRRVYTIAYAGMMINTTITTVLYSVLHWKLFIATVIAAAVAAIWNFLGQRIYAFRVKD